MMKKKLGVFVFLAVGGIVAAAVGCSDRLSRTYYARHPMSSEQVASVWGEPVAVISLEGGIEKRVYRIQHPITDLKYRYFLIRAGRVISSGITDQGAVPTDRKDEARTVFVPSDLSKAYYEKFSMSVGELNRIWGNPLHVDKAPDGTERRIYEIRDPYTDFRYRYFLVKDGRVVASRISPDKGFRAQAADRVQKGIEINEISQAYYERHPMTLAEVEKVWGQPVFVQKDPRGLEKRIYKITNPYPAGFEFRYFIVKNGKVVSSGITDTIDMTP